MKTANPGSQSTSIPPAPDTASATTGILDKIANFLNKTIGHSLIALAARLGIAGVFFMSGRTKVDGFLSVNETAFYLFENEYKLPFIPSEFAAYIATYSEHLFPILLALGLFTRYSALALLGMTAVIQIFVYPLAWPTHLTWAAILLYLAGRGAGGLSLDRVLGIK